jgi:raffinose/stachyose/melibiose transport system substrate-binding protein
MPSRKVCSMSQHTRSMRRALAPAAVSILAVSALALTGCTPAPAADATELTFYVPVAESGDNPYQVLATAFEKANPGITINVEEAGGDVYGQGLATKLQAGNAADVFKTAPGRGQLESVLTLAEAGYLAPLDDTTAATTIPSGNEALFDVDGTIYAQGLDFTVAAIVANLALMQADGIDAYPATYAELLTDCGIAKANGHSFFVIAGSMQPNTGFFSMVMSGDLVYGPNPSWNVDRQDGKVTFADDKGWQATLERFTELNDAGCFQEAPEAGTFDTITNNLVGELSYAGAIPSGAAFGLGGANPNANFVVNPFPAKSTANEVVSASVNYALSINAKAAPERIALAKKFLEYAASPEGAAIYAGASGNLPVVGADFSALPPQYGGVAQLLTDGKTYALPNSAWESPEVYAALGTGVQGILTGQATVQDVLSEMDSSW